MVDNSFVGQHVESVCDLVKFQKRCFDIVLHRNAYGHDASWDKVFEIQDGVSVFISFVIVEDCRLVELNVLLDDCFVFVQAVDESGIFDECLRLLINIFIVSESGKY